MTDQTLSIGEVAAEAGVSVSAIRFYEREGLLPEAEREAGRRRFGSEAVRRLRVIGAAKGAGLSLDEIGGLLRSIDRGAPLREPLRELAGRKLPMVEEEIARATAAREWLELASSCGCGSLEACALFASAA